MTEFESLLREIAKVDCEIDKHFDKYPDTRGVPLAELSDEAKNEWAAIVRRKYMALDAIAAIAVAKYKHEQQ